MDDIDAKRPDPIIEVKFKVKKRPGKVSALARSLNIYDSQRGFQVHSEQANLQLKGLLMKNVFCVFVGKPTATGKQNSP